MIFGMLSRKFNFIPLFIGDGLYALMIYFGFCFLFPIKNRIHILLMSLLFCFTIEFAQLIKWNWLKNIRSTTLGHYILGEGFLWLDLLCYFLGVNIAYLIDKKILKA
jgi:hypothetical protein